MDKKIKVAFLDYSPHYAGAERAMETILTHLDRVRYEPYLVAPVPRSHYARFESAGLKIFYLNNRIKWWMGRLRWRRPLRGTDLLMRTLCGIQLLRFLRRRGIRILHVNLLRPDSFMWVLPVHWAGIKVVGHFRSLPESWVPPVRVQKRCDAIICVSHIVKEHLLSIYPHPWSRVIYDAVSLELVKEAKSKSRRKLGFHEERRLIASVGALSPIKVHDNAIRAFALLAGQFPRYDLLIAGGESKDEVQRLRNIAAEYPVLDGRVFYTEHQIAHVACVYNASDIVLSLTKEGEAFGLVPLEAALAGTPSVVPLRGAIVEFTEHNRSAFWVETNSVEEISSMIIRLLSAPDHAAEVCANLRKIVTEKFSVEAYVKQIENLYEELMKL